MRVSVALVQVSAAPCPPSSRCAVPILRAAEEFLTQGAGAQHNMAFAMAKTPCKDVFAQSLACFQDSQAHDDDDTGECTELNIDMGMCIGTNAKEIQQSPYFEESVRRAAQARGEL